MECHKRSKLQPGDVVMVMWSGIERNDLYIDYKWQGLFQMADNKIDYPIDWMILNTDMRTYYMRDIPLIAYTKSFLEMLGVEFYFFSIYDLDGSVLDHKNILPKNDVQDICKLYQEDLSIIRPSAFNIIYNYDWNTLPDIRLKDFEKRHETHPFPMEVVKYLDTVLPEYPISDAMRSEMNSWNELIVKYYLNHDPDATAEFSLKAKNLRDRFPVPKRI